MLEECDRFCGGLPSGGAWGASGHIRSAATDGSRLRKAYGSFGPDSGALLHPAAPTKKPSINAFLQDSTG